MEVAGGWNVRERERPGMTSMFLALGKWWCYLMRYKRLEEDQA